MSEIPSELKYSESHEWARLEEDGLVRVGITDHAQNLLGDMVFVELPDLETSVKSGGECAVVESVKAASDVYSPITGEVVSVNELLADDPGIVNSDPYGDGWLFVVKPDDDNELREMLDADQYAEQISDD